MGTGCVSLQDPRVGTVSRAPRLLRKCLYQSCQHLSEGQVLTQSELTCVHEAHPRTFPRGKGSRNLVIRSDPLSQMHFLWKIQNKLSSKATGHRGL